MIGMVSSGRRLLSRHHPVCYALVLQLLLTPIAVFAVTAQPDVVVRQIFGELIARLDERRQHDDLTDIAVREIMSSLLSPRIDFSSLSRWILREHWANATEDQRTSFRDAFEDYIINTYALALAGGQKIELNVADGPKLRENAAVVFAAFKVENADAIPLEFRLISRDDKWLLFDVSLSGVSLAKTFRSDFSYVARDGGIDAVIQHLQQRTAGSASP